MTNNFFRKLKYIPWRSLFIIAGITFAITTAIEILLWLLFNQLDRDSQSEIVRTLVFAPYLPFLIFSTSFASGIGIGALAVYLLETIDKQVFITASVLWSLILCLLVGLVVRSYLPIPDVPIPLILIGTSSLHLISIVLGVFWKGKRYWR